MAENLRFDDRVVIITGAGSGLGRQYALEFGRRGAKVVVNDLGGSSQGEGSSNRAADTVVEQIKKAGGIAVSNYDSVEFGDRIVQTAMDSFGRVDVIINNAGILRDSSMLKMTQTDWDLIMKVHLKGSFSVTRAAWAQMRKQKYGRIINTASGSGIYGNFGQANYATAKLGIHGFTQTLAIEGAKYDIKVNSMAPVALSRMTETMFQGEMQEIFAAQKVVPLVVFMAHESFPESGALFEAAGGWMTRVRWQRADGLFIKGQQLTAENIKRRWEDVNRFDQNCDFPHQNTQTMQRVMQKLEQSKLQLR